jgi:hypothetical protein
MMGGYPLQRGLQRLRETTSVERGPGCVPWAKLLGRRWDTDGSISSTICGDLKFGDCLDS